MHFNLFVDFKPITKGYLHRWQIALHTALQAIPADVERHEYGLANKTFFNTAELPCFTP